MISVPMQPIPTLLDRLRHVAGQWCDANDASMAKLGRAVINDGGFFTRIVGQSGSTTTATLEKFARYLIDPVNWPEGAVARDAIAFGHVVGVIPQCEAAATGLPGELSGPRQATQQVSI